MKALADDDDEMVVLAMALAAKHQASSSRRRRAPDAPPRQEIRRDHAYGHARICADYFGCFLSRCLLLGRFFATDLAPTPSASLPRTLSDFSCVNALRMHLRAHLCHHLWVHEL
jgi:hypothetical protein